MTRISGNRAVDTSGNGNHGELNKGIAWDSGKPTVPDDNKYHHIVRIWDGSSETIYVDFKKVK